MSRSTRVTGARKSLGEQGSSPPKRASARASAVSYAEPSDDDEDEGEVDELNGDEDEDGVGEDDEADAEGEEEGGDEDGEGEEEDGDGEGEGEEDEDGDGDDVDDQMDVDAEGEEEEEEQEEEQEKVTKIPSVKIRFKLAPTLAPVASSSTGSIKRAYKKAKRTHDAGSGSDDPDELSEDDSRRSISPSKLTARQRAKYDKDLQDTLLSLPAEGGNKKAVILTEAERVQRREENARRRKRQTEQRQQDEQDQTINRLLRAQTAKSRSKLDAPASGDAQASGSGQGSGSGPGSNNADGEGDDDQDPKTRKSKPLAKNMAPKDNMIRYISRLDQGGCLVSLVAVPGGRENWLGMGLEAKEVEEVGMEEVKS